MSLDLEDSIWFWSWTPNKIDQKEFLDRCNDLLSSSTKKKQEKDSFARIDWEDPQ